MCVLFCFYVFRFFIFMVLFICVFTLLVFILFLWFLICFTCLNFISVFLIFLFEHYFFNSIVMGGKFRLNRPNKRMLCYLKNYISMKNIIYKDRNCRKKNCFCLQYFISEKENLNIYRNKAAVNNYHKATKVSTSSYILQTI